MGSNLFHLKHANLWLGCSSSISFPSNFDSYLFLRHLREMTTLLLYLYAVPDHKRRRHVPDLIVLTTKISPTIKLGCSKSLDGCCHQQPNLRDCWLPHSNLSIPAYQRGSPMIFELNLGSTPNQSCWKQFTLAHNFAAAHYLLDPPGLSIDQYFLICNHSFWKIIN